MSDRPPFDDRLQSAPGTASPGKGGRAGNGRFAKGNPGGPGNPNAGAVAKARSAFMAALRDADVVAALQTIREVMKDKGNKPGERLAAAEALLDRVLGKPVAADLLERVEALERTLSAAREDGASCPA